MVRNRSRQKKASAANLSVEFYLQLSQPDGGAIWEEVDQYVFENQERAVDKTGEQPRYTGNFLIKTPDGYSLKLEHVSYEDIAVAMRMLAVNMNGVGEKKGFVRKPEYIKIRQAKSRLLQLYELGTGQRFKVA